MFEAFTSQLGKPVQQLLESSLGRWPLHRHLLSYKNSRCGIEVSIDYFENVRSIFLKPGDVAHQLLELPFSTPRSEVLNLLGAPSRSGSAPGTNAPWDRFDRPGHAVHCEYDRAASSLTRITFFWLPPA